MLSQKFYVWLRIIDRKLDWPQLNISFAFSSFSVCCKSLLSIEYWSAELFKNKVHTGFARVIINYSKELTEAQLKLRLDVLTILYSGTLTFDLQLYSTK